MRILETYIGDFEQDDVAEQMPRCDNRDISVSGNSAPTSTYLKRPLRSFNAAKSMRKLETQSMLDDERHATRYVVNQLASAFVPKKFFGIPCIIRDISKTGACLEFCEETLMMPHQLILYIDDFQFRVDCEPRWHDQHKMGLLFMLRKRRA